MTILLIIGILCILGAAVLAVMAFLPGKGDAKPFKLNTPQPATAEAEEDDDGEEEAFGELVFHVEGMTSLSRIAAVEEAIGKFDTLTTELDSEACTLTIRHEGIPDLKSIKALRQTIEAAGCKLTRTD